MTPKEFADKWHPQELHFAGNQEEEKEIAEFDRDLVALLESERGHVRKFLASPWPPKDCLRILLESTNHHIQKHDCCLPSAPIVEAYQRGRKHYEETAP